MIKRTSVRGCQALVAAALLSGCASSRDLVFTTYTKVGIDISAVNGAPAEAVFGYKRFEGAIVPVDPMREPARGKPQIPNLFATMNLKNGWFSGVCIAQTFATGEAAKQISTAGEIAPGTVSCE